MELLISNSKSIVKLLLEPLISNNKIRLEFF
jgi:hypothetical protein